MNKYQNYQDELLDDDDMLVPSGRGFAGMDQEKQRKIASKGGKAAHKKGTAHEWNSSEAKAAGRKGGQR